MKVSLLPTQLLAALFCAMFAFASNKSAPLIYIGFLLLTQFLFAKQKMVDILILIIGTFALIFLPIDVYFERLGWRCSLLPAVEGEAISNQIEDREKRGERKGVDFAVIRRNNSFRPTTKYVLFFQ